MGPSLLFGLLEPVFKGNVSNPDALGVLLTMVDFATFYRARLHDEQEQVHGVISRREEPAALQVKFWSYPIYAYTAACPALLTFLRGCHAPHVDVQMLIVKKLTSHTLPQKGSTLGYWPLFWRRHPSGTPPRITTSCPRPSYRCMPCSSVLSSEFWVCYSVATGDTAS